MRTSIKKELAQHIIDKINDGILTNENKNDWHHYAFNEDYYIIGYYRASEWLKEHDIDAFEAIGVCQEYERDNFGEINKIYDNSETTVNMLTCIWGEELLSELDAETIEELTQKINETIGQ